jgi:hypothetical protein
VALAVAAEGQRDRRPWFLLAPLLVTAARLKRQAAPRIPRTIKEVTEIAGMFAGPVWRPPRCDVGGNTYLRMYQADDPLAAPVVRLPRRGDAVTRFDIRAARGFEHNDAYGLCSELAWRDLHRRGGPRG